MLPVASSFFRGDYVIQNLLMFNRATKLFSISTRQMLIEHQQLRPRGAFILCPQLRLLWNPVDPRDRRANLPDVGIGRLQPKGTVHLQGGAEQKAPIIPLMATLPCPDSIIDNSDLRRAVARAALQAADQVKAAIKNGAVPDHHSIEWIVAIGPYFIVRSFGPFSEAELDTRALVFKSS